MTTPALYIGIISGTSMDAVDCILADYADNPPRLLGTHRHPIPDNLRVDILRLCDQTSLSPQMLGATDVRIGELFAEAIEGLLSECGVAPDQIIAIGSHGQTIQHHPDIDHPFTLQIGDPNIIAARTGITTVADFRRRDMALGGQGAPLAPLFHQAVFGTDSLPRVVLNLGGIANITVLSGRGETILRGFDTGPANVLMDSWIGKHRNEHYDAGGTWAASGQLNAGLLEVLMDEPYLRQAPPKSTGRELFNLLWLERKLNHFQSQQANEHALEPEDVQATLLEFTARTVCESVQSAAPDCREMIVCGGGAYNSALVARLQMLLPELRVASTDDYGIAPDWVEAMAFAWLAMKRMKGEAVDCTSLTGAKSACVLGGVYF